MTANDRPALTPSETAGRTPALLEPHVMRDALMDIVGDDTVPLGEAWIEDKFTGKIVAKIVALGPVSPSPAVGEPPQEQDQQQNRLAETEKVQQQSPQTSPNPLHASDAVDAARWRALLACGRIRVLGGACLGTPDALLGVEFYIHFPTDPRYPSEAVSLAQRNADAGAELTAFADTARATTDSLAGASVLAVDPAERSEADSWSIPQAVGTTALTPSVASPGDANGE